MRGYLFALFVTAVISSVISVLACGGFEKYVKYIASLVCASVIIIPIKNIDFSSCFEYTEYSASATEAPSLLYSESARLTEQSATSYITELIFNKFGINVSGVSIKIDWEKKDPIIEAITVSLNKEDIALSGEIKGYLYEILGGEVKVIEG